MDGVEQRNRLIGLVGLKPADAMEPDMGMSRPQGRPFGEGFLDPIFAKLALPGRDQCFDLFVRPGLRHGYERDVARIAARKPGRRGYRLLHIMEAGGGIAHR